MKRRWIIIGVLGLLPVAYFALAGPAVWLHNNNHMSRDFIEAAYSPAESLDRAGYLPDWYLDYVFWFQDL